MRRLGSALYVTSPISSRTPNPATDQEMHRPVEDLPSSQSIPEVAQKRWRSTVPVLTNAEMVYTHDQLCHFVTKRTATLRYTIDTRPRNIISGWLDLDKANAAELRGVSRCTLTAKISGMDRQMRRFGELIPKCNNSFSSRSRTFSRQPTM